MTESTYSDLISVLLESSRHEAHRHHPHPRARDPRDDGARRLKRAPDAFNRVLSERKLPEGAEAYEAGQPPLELSAGDLVVLLRGDRHLLAAGPVTTGEGTRLPEPRPDGTRLTELICGRFDFGDMLVGEILDDLPDLLLVRGDSMRLDGLARLRDTLAECIGCGCLSLRVCRLYNPDDAARELGPGPRFLLGDSAGDILTKS